MAISTAGAENEIDNAFVDTFYNRYVAQGQASLVEKHVSNGAETVASIREILEEMYSLVIVGKGGRRNCPLTTGLSDWEECPELGSVGDLLASPEMNFNGSLLVIQRHRHSEADEDFIAP
ncbi:CATION EXCHANGER 1 [Hibiscus trionum]|uniref:CATION EXCHANGER 1 n=1 Tax=Hibiscus trionum TaxID=183268 RepID=A0A9W7GY60_HIBTR|nr:CATION EXCHANGER 1 [Hibiscus trionum]